MRLLCVGYPMPNSKVDNHTILSAPSLFDYDAVLVDPSSISSAIETVLHQSGEARTFDGRPIGDGPSTAVHAGLAEVLRSRLGEAELLLARGGLLMVFGYPNVHHPVAGFNGCDRYFWLPAPSGLTWGPPDLIMGAGRQVVLADQTHPFASYIDETRGKLAYRAYFGDRARFGEGARVFARSPGGTAVGVEIAMGAGTIVVLPPPASVPAGTERGPIAKRLLDAAERLLGRGGDEIEPPWLASQPLPGLEQREASLAEAEDAATSAEARVDEERRAFDEIAKYRRLLWQEGRHRLDPIVLDAFRLLGFEIRGAPDEPATLAADGAGVLLEIEGSAEQVGMSPHYRLRERRERHLADRGELPPGLLVVNGQRLKAPDDRDQPCAEPLRIAAESMGYGILTTVSLFSIVRRALAEPDPRWLAAVRSRLRDARGVITEDLPSIDLDDIPSRLPSGRQGPTAH